MMVLVKRLDLVESFRGDGLQLDKRVFRCSDFCGYRFVKGDWGYICENTKLVSCGRCEKSSRRFVCSCFNVFGAVEHLHYFGVIEAKK